MADKEDIVLEKPEDTLNEPRLDESLGEFKGQEGQAPEDEEFASLPEELPRKIVMAVLNLQEKAHRRNHRLLKR